MFLPKIIWLFWVWLLLIFPLVSFKLGMTGNILPAVEIIIVYYYSSNYQIKFWQIFIAGIFFDQLYGVPIGTNSFMFIIANLGLKLVNRWFLLKDYSTNFFIFFGYCLLVVGSKYVIIAITTLHRPVMLPIIFQYLTTVFSYPLLKVPLESKFWNFKNA